MPSRIIWGLMAAICLWGLFHAYGAFQLNHNPWRAVVLVLCVGTFLAFWGLMLHLARHKFRRRGNPFDAP